MSRLSKGHPDMPAAESAVLNPSPPTADSLSAVVLTREDILAIEDAAHARITAGAIQEGFQLLGRCLAWRYESGLAGEPSNVVELHGHSRQVPRR